MRSRAVPERAAEAGVGAVGHHHVAGPHRLLDAPSSASITRATVARGRPRPAGRRPPRRSTPRRRPRPPRRRPSRRGRGAAPRSRSRGSRGAPATRSSRVTPWAIERRPSKRRNRDERRPRPMSSSWRTARGVSPSPQVFSRGKRFFSTTSTRWPASASQYPVAAPAGPPADDQHVPDLAPWYRARACALVIGRSADFTRASSRAEHSRTH